MEDNLELLLLETVLMEVQEEGVVMVLVVQELRVLETHLPLVHLKEMMALLIQVLNQVQDLVAVVEQELLDFQQVLMILVEMAELV